MEPPLGFRFSPTEEEAVKAYLHKRVRGEPLPWNGIMDCDVYGDMTPWQIFQVSTNLFPPNIWYCFTRLKKTSKSRVSRITANGTWHGEKSAVEISDSETKKVIAIKKTFAFKIKGEGVGVMNQRDKGTSWIMHEYSLIRDKNCSDIVLCKIKKKSSKDGTQENEYLATQLPVVVGGESEFQAQVRYLMNVPLPEASGTESLLTEEEYRRTEEEGKLVIQEYLMQEPLQPNEGMFIISSNINSANYRENENHMEFLPPAPDVNLAIVATEIGLDQT